MDKNTLRIFAPAGVKLALYKGFLAGDEIPAAREELGRKGTTYVFGPLEVGDYHIVGAGEGRFTRSKAFYFSEEKAATGFLRIFSRYTASSSVVISMVTVMASP